MLKRPRQERLAIDQLRRFWDDLLQGNATQVRDTGLDPAIVETVHGIHARDRVPPIDPGFVDRLLGELTNRPDAAMLPYVAPVEAVGKTPEEFNGRTARFPARWPQREPRRNRRSWVLAQAATAALLLVTFLAIYLVFRDDPTTPVVAPDTEATPSATPVPTLTSEPLLTVTFPAGSLPITDEGFFVFARYSVGPGLGYQYPNTCPPGAVVSLVESGTFSVTAAGPIDVFRGPASAAPGTRETVASGTLTTLEPGDALAYRNTTVDLFGGFDNPGATPLVVLEAVWFPSAACVGGPPSGMHVAWDSYDETPGIDPTRPVTVTLRRVTAVPGSVLTGEEAAAVGNVPADERFLERLYVESGTLEVIGLSITDAASPQAETPMLIQGAVVGVGGFAAVNLDAPPDGAQLRNAGDGPLVATVLTIQYAPP